MTLETGTQLGPYKIVAPLGAGGMGEVYRAKDTRLKREVAIKVLPERLAKDREALNRFEREAQAVAALSHPNILAIHDVGTERETSYVVTELLQGETLRERVRRSAIPWRKAVEISAAIADGLAAAHAKGIIHRDLKPENIFLTKDGVVKILDFGLAHIAAAGSCTPSEDQADTPTMTLDTRPGTVLGTINYMSPEQVRGQRTDARSDIFSFGCVLYEMVTGRRAFTGDTSADMMTAILKEEPPSVATSLTGIGPELDRTITRCLEKDAQQRFQSSGDLSFTLRNILSASGHAAPTSDSRAPRTMRLLWMLAVVAVIIVGGFYVFREAWTGRDGSVDAIDSLAILPFVNVGGDPDAEYLGEEIPATIIDSMSQLLGLRVVPRSTVFRLAKDRTEHRQIAKELGVRAILSGEVSQRGKRLSVRVALVDARSDRQLWGERYDRTEDDILAIEKDIAAHISEALRMRLTGEQKEKLVKSYTENRQAYRAYKEARFWWNKRTQSGFSRAIALYDEAIDIDPKYALAYAGKADCYCMAGYYFRPAREVARKAMEAVDTALALDSQLPEAYPPRAWVRAFVEWDWAGAEGDFRTAIKLNPDYATAHSFLSIFLAAQGRLDEAEREIRLASELDPGSLIINRNLGVPYSFRRQHDRAIEQYRNTLRMDPTFIPARVILATALKANHQYDEAIAEIQRVYEEAGHYPRALGWLGAIYAAAGHLERARQELRTLTALSEQQYVPAVAFALIHAELGEYDAAFARLDEAFEARDESLVFLAVSPWFDALRADPRFDDLLRRIGLEDVPRPAAGMSAISPIPGKVMLAVLPFEDSSPEPQEWFSDGMTGELIATLGRIKALGVISRTSAMRYKNTDKTLQQIARELNVSKIVEGSVLRIGGRVRITVELIDAATDTHVWSNSYENELRDILALQGDVARAIAREIQVKLTPQEQARIVSARQVNPEAYEAYVKGRYYWNKRTEEGLKKSITYFEEAIDKDPSYALAYAGLADAWIVLGFNGHLLPREAMPRARTAALKALEIDDGLGEAHASLADVQYSYDWDFPQAGIEFKRALELNPSYATGHQWYSQLLLSMGRQDEAFKEIRRAQELDPLSLIINISAASNHYLARQYDQALEECRKTLELDPRFLWVHWMLGTIYEQKGMYDQAIVAHQTYLRNFFRATPEEVTAYGRAYAAGGMNAAHRWHLKYLEEESSRRHVPPFEFASHYALLGERDKAFEWLEKAYDQRDPFITSLKMEPSLDNLRDDPRFDDLLRRIGFPVVLRKERVDE